MGGGIFFYLGVFGLMAGGLISIIVVLAHIANRGPVVLREAADALAEGKRHRVLAEELTQAEEALKAKKKAYDDYIKEKKKS